MDHAMTLIFEREKVRYDQDTNRVRFRATDGDKLVRFAVTRQGLKDWSSRHGRAHNDPLDIYWAAEVSIQRIAERKYKAGNVGADGVIVISERDLID
jgi:hypothetical protein